MFAKESEALNRRLGTKEQGNPIQIKRLKLWACANLPASSRIRHVLLLEKDVLLVYEFLAKMDIWMKLVDLEERSQKGGGASSR